jgi:hypothetical protein
MAVSPAPRQQPRRFGIPGTHASAQLRKHHGFRSNQKFQPLPAPTGVYPYHFSLGDFLPVDDVNAIRAAGSLAFHIVGDTGGVKFPEPQQIVSMKLADDLNRTDGPKPAFMYILGDLIYFNGEASEYYPQFYEPYASYTAPIVAIPGNHDGDPIDVTVPSLAAFVDNFCATAPHITPEAQEITRDAMTEPNVYWTLDAPFITIVGLYSNVPEGGRLDGDQSAWLTAELQAAPKDAALVLTMHHPIYSVDAHHGGSSYLGDLVDKAIADSGRTPDLIMSGHVHNYQRFTRDFQGRPLLYVVNGAGGYWHLHYVAKDAAGNTITTPWQDPATGVTLESYADTRHGFLRMEVSADKLTGTYFAVPRPQESWHSPAQLHDTFVIPLRGAGG